MDPWFAKAAVLAASIAMVAIRAPHGQKSRSVEIAEDRKGSKEVTLLALAVAAFFVPLLWLVSPLFEFAEYPLHPLAWSTGVPCFAAGLWLFHRSHADLGTNWSITLQVRANHTLVTRGVYTHVRHPMYTALFLYSIGQTLALPNWFAGPSYLVAFGVLFALRVRDEERMMLDRFGDEYARYAARTKRLVPGVW